MPDAHFAEARLAEIYDDLDPDRSDLDVYAGLVKELRAQSVLDIGCGTGTFACLLTAAGLDVTGVDPAQASLNVARAKPGGDQVRWIWGDATELPPMRVEVATMTANVAQVFLTDEDWSATLEGISAAMRPRGRFVFETRDPARQAWRSWNRDETHSRVDTLAHGLVESWIDVLEVTGQYVTFRGTYHFEDTGDVMTSDSTLRFRERQEVERSLHDRGFIVVEIRDAPDRPGREFVFITELMARE